MKITIPAIPKSDNEFKGRKNVYAYRKHKEEWLEMVTYISRPKRPKVPYEKAIIAIKYFFPTRGRRDPDNYNGKCILDGLVCAGVIKDDSFACIKLLLDGGYDKDNPRTEVEIIETKESGWRECISEWQEKTSKKQSKTQGCIQDVAPTN